MKTVIYYILFTIFIIAGIVGFICQEYLFGIFCIYIAFNIATDHINGLTFKKLKSNIDTLKAECKLLDNIIYKSQTHYDSILSKKIRRTIMLHYSKLDNVEHTLDFSNLYKLQISAIHIDDTDEVCNITITLSRPGILIGKHGTGFEALLNVLKQELNKEVKITIKEDKIWHC